MRRRLISWLQRLLRLVIFSAFTLSGVAMALAAFFLSAHLLEPGEGTSALVAGLWMLVATGAGLLAASLGLLRPADGVWAALQVAAADLREQYFEAVFLDAEGEFDVWPLRRRSLRRWCTEDGLELLETGALTEYGFSVWVGVRSRRFLTRKWTAQASVGEAKRRLAAELDHLVAMQVEAQVRQQGHGLESSERPLRRRPEQ